MDTPATEKKTPSIFSRRPFKTGSKVFWIWIGYQAVKGSITLSVIWIPLAYAFFHHS